MKLSIDETGIYAVLSGALLAGRFAPGLRLGEQSLAEIFGCTRERIRKTLQRLGNERLIELQANRGAFVANPSLEEARQIYQARRIVEGGLTLQLTQSLTDVQLASLQAHLALERAADAAGNKAESVRLSGLFHRLLAEMTGNDYVVRQMHELVSRTAMIVAYHESGSPRCACDEHEGILSALIRRDAEGAARNMSTHLSLIETRLQPRLAQHASDDVETVVREELEAWIARQPAEWLTAAQAKARRQQREQARKQNVDQ